jgi:hypothetical protein
MPGLPQHEDHVIERVLFCADQWEHAWRYPRPATVAALRRIAEALHGYADQLERDPPRANTWAGAAPAKARTGWL